MEKTLTILEKKVAKIETLKVMVTQWKISLPEGIVLDQTDYMGIDPGTTHFGWAWTDLDTITLGVFHMERLSDPVERMKSLAVLLTVAQPSTWICRPHLLAVIEGASFSDNFRQVELAEQRASFVWWLWRERMMTDAMIVPPLSIRKTVFGSAKIKAEVYWGDEIDKNALAALSCLCYASIVNKRNEQ